MRVRPAASAAFFITMSVTFTSPPPVRGDCGTALAFVFVRPRIGSCASERSASGCHAGDLAPSRRARRAARNCAAAINAAMCDPASSSARYALFRDENSALLEAGPALLDLRDGAPPAPAALPLRTSLTPACVQSRSSTWGIFQVQRACRWRSCAPACLSCRRRTRSRSRPSQRAHLSSASPTSAARSGTSCLPVSAAALVGSLAI
jgi:hypothetical protein